MERDERKQRASEAGGMRAPDRSEIPSALSAHLFYFNVVFSCAEGTSGWGAPRAANNSCMKVFGRGYLGRKCSVFFAVW